MLRRGFRNVFAGMCRLANLWKERNLQKRRSTTRLLLEGLEDRITPNAYIWHPNAPNAPGTAVIPNFSWNATNMVMGITYCNWQLNGSNIYASLPGVNDTVIFAGDIDQAGCSVNDSAHTVSSFFMGKDPSTLYTGTLHLYFPLTAKGGGFTMQSGDITLDTGSGSSAALTIQDLPSGSNGGAWSGGKIEDATGCNGYVLIQASTKNTTINDTTSSTNPTTLYANMTIQGTSSFSATFALTNSMSANLVTVGTNTITVGNYGHLNMTAQNTDVSGGTTDNRGGITSSVHPSTYAIVVDQFGELDRGSSSDNTNDGGVLVDRPIENNGGTVNIYPGDRLDISGTDSNSNAFYQTGSTSVTTIYEVANSTTEYTGTLQTASYAASQSISSIFGNIEIVNGSLIVQAYNNGTGFTVPVFPALVMGPLVNLSGTAGKLIITANGTLYIASHGSAGNGFADAVGNVEFDTGATFEIDAYPNTPNWTTLLVISYNAATYDVTISSTSTTCTINIKDTGTFAQGTEIDPIFNMTGGNDGDLLDMFASIADNKGFTYSESWDASGHLVCTRN